MTDCVYVRDGRAQEIFRGVAKANLETRFAPSFLADVIETADNAAQEGDLWNGSAFAPAVSLPDYARNRSWEIRTGGAVIGGVPVRTKDTDIALIAGMALRAKTAIENSEAKSFNFDSGAGIVTLDAAQAFAFATAVSDWVQATFDKRAEILAAITAGTITTRAQVDAAFET